MREIVRQLVHFLLGAFFAGLVYFKGTLFSLEIAVVVFLVGLILALVLAIFEKPKHVHHIVRFVGRKREVFPGQAALLFQLAIIVTLLFFVFQPSSIAFGALLCLAVGDSMATVVGTRWGTHKLLPNRSMEGTFAGFAFSAIALFLFFNLPVALVAAAVGMAAEFLPIDDNFAIPLFSGLALMLLL
ncbi:MAG: hypothetical protein V1847_03060 [Candidatus Diapherotrites archaeon]